MKKILIIEDDEAIRNELKTFLCRYNYDALVIEKFENVRRRDRKRKCGFNSFRYKFTYFWWFLYM